MRGPRGVRAVRVAVALLGWVVGAIGAAAGPGPVASGPGRRGGEGPRSMAAANTLRAGDWSDPAVWSIGRVPGPGDAVTINHAVAVTDDRTVGTSGPTQVGAAATYSATAGATGLSTGNYLVRLTNVDASGRESSPTGVPGAGQAITAGSTTLRIALPALPVGVVGRNIYLFKSGFADYYRYATGVATVGGFDCTESRYEDGTLAEGVLAGQGVRLPLASAVYMGAAGRLALTGGTLTCRGDVLHATRASVSDALVGAPGGATAAGLEFDPPAGSQYYLGLSYSCRFTFNGTAAARCFVRTRPGAAGGKAYITQANTNCYFVATRTDFADLDSGSTPVNSVTGLGIQALYSIQTGAANQGVTLVECQFTRCGLVSVVIGGAGGSGRTDVTVDVRRCKWTDSVGPVSIAFGGENGGVPTAPRNLKDCAIDKKVGMSTGGGGSVPLRYFSCEGTVFGGGFSSLTAQNTVVPPAAVGCLFAGADGSGNNSSLVWNDLVDCYFFSAPQTGSASDDNFHGWNSGNSSPSDASYTGCVWEHAGNGGGGEYTFWGNGLGNTTAKAMTYEGCLFRLPGWPAANPKGGVGGMVFQTINATPTYQRWKFRHNTMLFTGRSLISGGIYTGEIGTELSGTIAEVKSNVFYYANPGVSPKYQSIAVTPAADVVLPGGVDRNLGYGYRATSGVAAHANNGNGYLGKFSATPGATDLEVALGRGPTGVDPGFVDTTRSLATFTRDYLGLPANRGAWADATAYAVGDVVEAATGGYYEGATIQYRCAVAHTSDAASNWVGQPGSAAEWRTNWEFYGLGVIGAAQVVGARIDDPALGLSGATYIEALRRWVLAGHAPTNVLLRGAGHDGATIGATEGAFARRLGLSGPSAGPLGRPAAFVVAPDGPYAGTVTPGDGGAGGSFSPPALVWAGEATAKAFTYTPSSVGARTVGLSDTWGLPAAGVGFTPTASGYALTGPGEGRVGEESAAFVVAPDGPYAGTVTPGDGGAGGSFSPPALVWAGDMAPRTFGYTPAGGGARAISATNDGGLRDAAAVPFLAVASAYALTGPAEGHTGRASAFTAAPNGPFRGAITPGDGGAGGSFSPPALVWAGEATAKAFAYTATTAGMVTIGATNDGGLADPASLAFVARTSAFDLGGPASGRIGEASAAFVVRPQAAFDGAVTPNDGGAGGTFAPPVLKWSRDDGARSFTYTPTTPGPRQIRAVNNAGLVDPPAHDYVATATAYRVDGPASGRRGSVSAAFVVTPNGPYRGAVTPGDGGQGGLFAPAVLAWDGEAGGKSFTYTPATSGARMIALGNDGGLSDPPAVAFVATAAGFGVSGPHPSGSPVLAASDFRVTPDGPFAGTLTPDDGGAGGTFEPPALTWAGEEGTKAFTYTPARAGACVISVSSGGVLAEPAPISYAVPDYTYTLTGPTAGVVGAAAGPFVVAPRRPMTGTVVLDDGGAGGTFEPERLSWSGGAEPRAFAYTPAASGAWSIGATNDAGFLDPAPVGVAVRRPGLFLTNYRATTWSDPRSWYRDPGPIPDDWDGVRPPPGVGDAVRIYHRLTIDGEAAAGTGESGGPAMVIAADVTIAEGAGLTVLGDVIQYNGVTVTGQGAGRIRFDAGRSPAGTSFTWQIGHAYIGGGPQPKLVIRGRAGARFRVESAGAGGAGRFTNGGFNAGGQIDAEYADFAGIGDATRGAMQVGTGASGTVGRLYRCTLTGCGQVSLYGPTGDATVVLRESAWVQPAAATLVSIAFVGADRTTGAWEVVGCDFAGPVQLRGRTFTISGNVHRAGWMLDSTAKPATPGPYAPTYLTLSGPAGGPASAASAPFTVALGPAGAGSAVAVTPGDGGAGGSFAPASVLLTGAAPSATFRYTPGSVGRRSIRLDCDAALVSGGALAPGAWAYEATEAATGYRLEAPRPASGLAGEAAPFRVLLPEWGRPGGAVRITPSDGGAGGSFEPASVVLDGAAPSATFGYRPSGPVGPRAVRTTNDGGLADPPPAGFLVVEAAAGYEVSGPSWGEVDRGSGAFVVRLGPGGVPGAVRVTPATSDGDGAFAPAYVDLTQTRRAASFEYTPRAWGARAVRTTNDGGLADPPAVAFLAKVQTGRSGHDPAGNREPSLGGYDLFATGALWRELGRRVDSEAVDPASDVYIARLAGLSLKYDGSTTTFNGGASIYGMPYNVVNGATARVPVTYTLYGAIGDPGPVPWPPDITLEAYYSPTHTPNNTDALPTDQHALVFVRDEATGGLAELWEAQDAWSEDGGATWKAHGGVRFDLATGAHRRAGWGSADAAGLPIVPLVARYDEVARGEIKHPIRITFGGYRNGQPLLRNKFVWPARGTSFSGSATDGLPFGARLRLTESWYEANKGGFTGAARVIVDALRRYGAIVADVGTHFSIGLSQDERWPLAGPGGIAGLSAILPSAFEVLQIRPQFALSGPATGVWGQRSTFTVSYLIDGDDNFRSNVYLSWTSDVDLPPANRTWRNTGLTPTVVMIDASRRGFTFQFTPPAAGRYLLQADPYEDWPEPPPLAFTAVEADTTLRLTAPSPALAAVGRESGAFVVALPPDLALGGRSVTVTPGDGGAGGRFVPASVVLSDAVRSGTFAYVAATAGRKQIGISNGGGLANPAAVELDVEGEAARRRPRGVMSRPAPGVRRPWRRP